jgi:hypothetical protein
LVNWLLVHIIYLVVAVAVLVEEIHILELADMAAAAGLGPIQETHLVEVVLPQVTEQHIPVVVVARWEQEIVLVAAMAGAE